MKYCFRLQHTLLSRHITEFGVPPSAGYPLALLVFVGVSFYLFAQTGMAEYIYLFVALSLVLNVGNARRNAFVKSCYSKSVYYKIRLLENGFVAAPFLCFLLFKQCYFISCLLILGTGSAVFVNLGPLFKFSLPTPFYKQPFEFIVGFRKNVLLVFFAYFLTLMCVTVDNFNLGLFSLLLVFLIGLSFYGNTESPYFVWMHNRTAKEFLHHKVIIALLHSTVLSSPVTACMLLFYTKNWGVIIAIQILGYLYLICMVLAKYSNFPYKISLFQGILLGLGLWFPPLLLGIIPFFYSQSVKRLNELLA